MNKIFPGKPLILASLVVALFSGCSSTPKSEGSSVPAMYAEAIQAITSAKAAVAKAKANDWIWRDTGKFLKQAESAHASGDSAAAVPLANKARNQADLAVDQYYLEKAKVMLAEANDVGGLSSGQQSTMAAAAAAIGKAQGRKAYDLLTPLLTELRGASMKVEVMGGDSLWSISGKEDVYANPYQWPLIYKANKSQIKDADLIFPGQVFSVNRNPSSAEANAAIEHAKTRGAWSVGEVEESDRQYLGGTLKLR